MARAGTSASVTAARWLVGITAAVVLAFVLSSIVGQHYENTIATRTELIVSNAMPSVKVLSNVRSNLLGIDNAADEYIHTDPSTRGSIQEGMRTARQNIEASLATYMSLPFFPNEPDLFAHVEDARRAMDVALDGFLAAPDHAHMATLDHEVARLDAATGRVIAFDAEQGQRLGLEIAKTHADARLLVALLDGIAVVLAVFATVLALRQLRRAAQTQATERAARELRERELASQNEALGQFAGRVAHDVLSPLATTQLSLDLLRETGVQTPATQRAVDRGMAALHRVHTLVEGLLAFSRAGGRPEPGRSTDVAAVIADVTAELAAQAQQEKIILEVSDVPPGAVACSAGVLTSVLVNLLRNAIKYMGDAPERRIELRVALAGDRWRFEVQDTGPGIAADQQRRIFEPYVQLAPASSGIGLGLATVDRLVRAHGGAIGVESEVGRGARFWFELPAWIAVPHAAVVPSPVPHAV